MDKFLIEVFCPNCNERLILEEGEEIVLCPHCGIASILSGGDAARKVMVRLSVDETAARDSFQQWLSHGWKARDLGKNAEITEIYPVYLPFWRMVAHAQAIACGFKKELRDIDKAADLAPKVIDQATGSTQATGATGSAQAGGAGVLGGLAGGLTAAKLIGIVVTAIVLGGAVMASGILTPVYPDSDITGQWSWGSIPGYGQVTMEIRSDNTFSAWSQVQPGSGQGASVNGRWTTEDGYTTLQDYDPEDRFPIKTVTIVASTPDGTRLSVKNPPFVPFTASRTGGTP